MKTRGKSLCVQGLRNEKTCPSCLTKTFQHLMVWYHAERILLHEDSPYVLPLRQKVGWRGSEEGDITIWRGAVHLRQAYYNHFQNHNLMCYVLILLIHPSSFGVCFNLPQHSYMV